MEEDKKKEGFFKRLGKEWKLQVGFCIVSILLLVIVYFPLLFLTRNGVIQKKILNEEVIEDNNVIADVTMVEIAEKKINLYGFAISLNAELQGIKVVLSPVSFNALEDKMLKTTLGQGANIQNYVEHLQEENKSGSGFKAEIERRSFQKDVCYEVLVHVEYKQDSEKSAKISSRKYLYNERVYPYNPLEFVSPAFENEWMKIVVEDGNLVAYTKDYGAWVYQYKNCLYWILDKSVVRNSEEDLQMFVHLSCTNEQDLPEDRKIYGFDNKDFSFKSKELAIDEMEKYRVAEMVLDTDYVITYIQTGEYDAKMQKNIWSVRFCMPIHVEE